MNEYIKHYLLRWQLIILYENTTKSCKKKKNTKYIKYFISFYILYFMKLYQDKISACVTKLEYSKINYLHVNMEYKVINSKYRLLLRKKEELKCKGCVSNHRC